MAKLAIKGHATKGDEVIEIIGTLGGSNAFGHIGNNPRAIYYIDETYKNFITCSETKKVCDCVIFTLEEFLEKFPYKIGDTVIAYAEGCIAQFTIQDMRWNYELNKVEYKICSSWCDTSLMQPYKEETMEEKGILTIDFTKDTRIADEVEVILGDYEFVLKDGKTYFVKKKPKYPKTYEECCKVLQMPKDESYIDIDAPLSYNKVLTSFTQLLICRDAYWKFADDWHPDWQDSNFKYCIKSMGADVIKGSEATICCILAFPTEETRNAFYENFKDLIEQCKKLL